MTVAARPVLAVAVAFDGRDGRLGGPRAPRACRGHTPTDLTTVAAQHADQHASVVHLSPVPEHLRRPGPAAQRVGPDTNLSA